MILSINSPHFSEDKLQVRADFLALICKPHLVTKQTYAQFQGFIQIKSQEQEVCGTTEACNFLSSQEQVSTEYQITSTLNLPKASSMLDLQSLEDNSVTDLVINATQTPQVKPYKR